MKLSVVLTDTLDMVADFHVAANEKIADKPCIPGLNAQSRAELFHIGELVEVATRAARRYLDKYAPDAKPQCMHRARLMCEELGELIEAMALGNVAHVLKELADNRYVQDGTIQACGLAPVFAECIRRVHESNMSKGIDGVFKRDENGKVIKGDAYRPAKLEDLVP